MESMSFGPGQVSAAMEQIEEWRGKAFVVGPLTIQEIPSMHRLALQVVYIDADDRQTVYPTGGYSGKTPEERRKHDEQAVWALGWAGALSKIAQAAQVEWDGSRSMRTDDGSNPDLISFVAVGHYRTVLGTSHEISGTYALDLAARREELQEKKWEDWYWKRGEGAVRQNRLEKAYPETERDGWAKYNADKDILRMRVHGVSNCESSARCRAVSSGLGVKRGGYKKTDLRTKPFVVLCLVPDIDWMNDPMAHGALIGSTLGMSAMAGARPSAMARALSRDDEHEALPAGTIPAKALPQTPEVPDADAPLPEPDAMPEPDKGADLGRLADGRELPPMDVFEDLERPVREGWVKALLAERAHTSSLTADGVKAQSDDKLAQFFRALARRPRRA